MCATLWVKTHYQTRSGRWRGVQGNGQALALTAPFPRLPDCRPGVRLACCSSPTWRPSRDSMPATSSW